MRSVTKLFLLFMWSMVSLPISIMGGLFGVRRELYLTGDTDIIKNVNGSPVSFKVAHEFPIGLIPWSISCPVFLLSKNYDPTVVFYLDEKNANERLQIDIRIAKEHDLSVFVDTSWRFIFFQVKMYFAALIVAILTKFGIIK